VSIETIIAAERERYIAFFTAAVGNLRASEKDIATELLISIDNETIPYPYRYFRADVVAKEADGQPKLFQLATNPDDAFEPTGFNFGAFQVEVYPFTWDSVQIVFDRAPILAQLEGWITRWLDVDEVGPHRAAGLDGAVHAFSQVETNGEWWYLTADFGTAPADALIEFIELMASQGMTRIVLKYGGGD